MNNKNNKINKKYVKDEKDWLRDMVSQNLSRPQFKNIYY
jgi:hypothetical protein